MSLREARSIAKRARKAGRTVSITTNREACNVHSPTRHAMSGNYVVVALGTEGQYDTAQYLWA